MASVDYATTDFFRDKDLFQDPSAYYEWIRAQGPVWRGPKRGVVFVSGYADDAFARNLPEGQDFVFLPKPFSLKQLIETVKGLMN